MTRPTDEIARYGGTINRLVRALLVVSVLALLFAPGLTTAHDESPSTLTAAVLAPTSHDAATTPARPTAPTDVVELFAVVAAIAAVAGTPRRCLVRPTVRRCRVDVRPRAFSRRGPPALVA